MTSSSLAPAGLNDAAAFLRVERRGAIVEIVLDRPRAMNALTTRMRATMADALPGLARDPQVYAIVVRSAVDTVFSAGGDIREITDLHARDPAAARRSLAEEYGLNWLHECFSKPTVSLIDGLVVGSGVGITLYGTHRVAGPRYQFAMPETGIGLFPDDGVAHAFARMPDQVGVYLGLTGRRIGRADALALGLVTHCIAADRFDEIRAALAEAWPVDPLLDERHEAPGAGGLDPFRPAIARCFAAPTIPGILERLSAEQGANAAWAGEVRTELMTKAPLSLEVTLRHIREAAALDLRLTLMRDYRLACRFLDAPDFREGVRALIIDKDHAPRWQPAALAEVSMALVDRTFAPMHGDLVLPTRQEMQAQRA